MDPSNRDLATEQLTYKIGSWMRQLHSLIEHDQEALDSEEETLAKVRQHQQEVLEKVTADGARTERAASGRRPTSRGRLDRVPKADSCIPWPLVMHHAESCPSLALRSLQMQGHGDTVLGNAACVPLHNLELDRLLTNFRGVVVVPWIPLRVDEEALEEQGTGEANGTQHGDPSIRGQVRGCRGGVMGLVDWRGWLGLIHGREWRDRGSDTRVGVAGGECS